MPNRGWDKQNGAKTSAETGPVIKATRARALVARFDSEDAIRSDERLLIAREIHDSTSQLLVVLQLQLGQLRRLGDPEIDLLIGECEQSILAIRQQIRSLDLDKS